MSESDSSGVHVESHGFIENFNVKNDYFKAPAPGNKTTDKITKIIQNPTPGKLSIFNFRESTTLNKKVTVISSKSKRSDPKKKMDESKEDFEDLDDAKQEDSEKESIDQNRFSLAAENEKVVDINSISAAKQKEGKRTFKLKFGEMIYTINAEKLGNGKAKQAWKIMEGQRIPQELKGKVLITAVGNAEDKIREIRGEINFGDSLEVLNNNKNSTKSISNIAYKIEVVTNADETNPHEFVAMADKAEGDLDGMMKNSQYTPLEVAQTLHGCIQGMAELHSLGSAAGDVKPDNVFVYKDTQGYVGKLADLGKSKRVEDKEQWYAGNSRFAPPEGVISKKGDVYGFGMMTIRAFEEMIFQKEQQEKAKLIQEVKKNYPDIVKDKDIYIEAENILSKYKENFHEAIADHTDPKISRALTMLRDIKKREAVKKLIQAEKLPKPIMESKIKKSEKPLPQRRGLEKFVLEDYRFPSVFESEEMVLSKTTGKEVKKSKSWFSKIVNYVVLNSFFSRDIQGRNERAWALEQYVSHLEERFKDTFQASTDPQERALAQEFGKYIVLVNECLSDDPELRPSSEECALRYQKFLTATKKSAETVSQQPLLRANQR